IGVPVRGHLTNMSANGELHLVMGHRLWLADYRAHWTVPPAWDRPWLLQYTETGRIAGVPNHVDPSAAIPPDSPGHDPATAEYTQTNNLAIGGTVRGSQRPDCS